MTVARRLWSLSLAALVALVAVGCSARPQAPQPTLDARPEAAPAPVVGGLDYEVHIEHLRQRLPHDGFHVVIEKPFVVVGDESAATVQRRAIQTVRWAVTRLKKAYFRSDPDHILDVWLFKDKASYQKHTRQVFGTVPSTPYGFYSPHHKALIMNIATGGGTLVHEIVHPYIAANFPGCPAWFNEGLGSLYEQSRDVEGEIMGSTNWRLAGLQDALRENRVPSFARLTAMSDEEFYERDRGTNYAQARYLCFYLQEQKLLRRFFREFRANRATDPTGYATLQAVLGKADAAAFFATWRAFVLALRFGG